VRVPADATKEATVTIRVGSKVNAPDVTDRTIKVPVR
jgi:hypothetical protein